MANKRPLDLQKFIIATLRRASYRWPGRTQAKSAARVERGLYKCGNCSNLFGPKEVHLDHIVPVVDIKTGFVDFNTYIPRLFCDASNYQVLCVACHSAKTDVENEMRKILKKSKKKK